MDHFEQGLRGDIKSVIVGQTFASFQDMHQRAVKVARVLEENEKETQILSLEQKRKEQFRQNSQNRTEKRSRPDYPLEKDKQPMSRASNNPPCQYCGRPHSGICFFREGRCFECREKGHKRSECPKHAGKQDRAPFPTGLPRPLATLPRPPIPPTRGRPPAPGTAQHTRNNNKPQAGGRIFCLEVEEEGDEDPHAIISGMLLVNTVPVIVLFDADATHSFVNPVAADRMDCKFENLEVRLGVTTPIGSVYQVERIARDCTIIILGRLFLGDLILLGIQGYDVILGMDWLTQYQATINCTQKILTLTTSEGERIQYEGGDFTSTIPLISSTKACKLIGKGCTMYLCAVKASNNQESGLKGIPLVRDFPEVFQEVPGLPPD